MGPARRTGENWSRPWWQCDYLGTDRRAEVDRVAGQRTRRHAATVIGRNASELLAQLGRPVVRAGGEHHLADTTRFDSVGIDDLHPADDPFVIDAQRSHGRLDQDGDAPIDHSGEKSSRDALPKRQDVARPTVGEKLVVPFGSACDPTQENISA